jgi:hypothetical protein
MDQTLYSRYKRKLDSLNANEIQSIIEKTSAKDGPSAQLSSSYEYVLLFDEYPNPTVINIPNSGISRNTTEAYLKNGGWEILKVYGYIGEKSEFLEPFGQLWVHLEKKCILHISLLQATEENLLYGIDTRQHEWVVGDISMGIVRSEDKGSDMLFISDIIIKHPSVISNDYDEEFIFKMSKDLLQFKNAESKGAKIKIVASEMGD